MPNLAIMKGGFMTQNELELYGLSFSCVDKEKSFSIYEKSTNNNIINLYLNKQNLYICPNCGSTQILSRGSKSKIIKTSSGCIDNIVVKLHLRHFKCKNCNKTFHETFDFLSAPKNISMQKDYKILQALKDINSTFKSVAARFDVSTTYVVNLFDQKVDIPRLKLPRVLCVDEVYAKKLSYHKYCFILYAPQLKKVVDVLDSRRINNLDYYFFHIPANERNNVEFFSIDLYDTYRQIGKKFFTKAKICADSFHVIKNLANFFHKLRIKIMNKYAHLKYSRDNYYWLFKKYYKLLTKDSSKLSYKRFIVNQKGQFMNQREIVHYMLTLDEQLKKAYELYQEYLVFNDKATLDNAKEWLDDLIHRFKLSCIKEFIPAWKLLENWHDEIVNSFHKINGYRISNGPMERVNGSIKTIFRLSYGARNFPRMRNRIMYVLNDDSAILYNRKSTTNKHIGRLRGPYKK